MASDWRDQVGGPFAMPLTPIPVKVLYKNVHMNTGVAKFFTRHMVVICLPCEVNFLGYLSI